MSENLNGKLSSAWPFSLPYIVLEAETKSKIKEFGSRHFIKKRAFNVIHDRLVGSKNKLMSKLTHVVLLPLLVDHNLIRELKLAFKTLSFDLF